METFIPSSDDRYSGESSQDFRSWDRVRTYSWRCSLIPTNTPGETFVVLHSSTKIGNFLKYKKLEAILLGLSDTESQMIFDSPGFFGDSFYLDLLEAYASLDKGISELPYIEVLNRYNLIMRLLGKPEYSWNLLFTYKGNLRYKWYIEVRPIRPFRKYSGYVKSPSAVGSKHRTQVFDLDTETPALLMFEKRKIVPFLLGRELDFNLLGVSPESLLYPLLNKSIESKTALPPEWRKYLIFVSERDL